MTSQTYMPINGHAETALERWRKMPQSTIAEIDSLTELLAGFAPATMEQQEMGLQSFDDALNVVLKPYGLVQRSKWSSETGLVVEVTTVEAVL